MREFIPSQLISAGASSRRPLPATDTPLGTPRWCGWRRATRRCRTFLPAGSSMSSGVKRRVCRAPIDIVPKFLVRTLTKRWSSRMSPSSSSPNTYAPAFGSFRQNLAVRRALGNKRPVVRPVAAPAPSPLTGPVSAALPRSRPPHRPSRHAGKPLRSARMKPILRSRLGADRACQHRLRSVDAQGSPNSYE